MQMMANHPQLTVLLALLAAGLGLRGVGIGLSWVFDRYPRARPWVFYLVLLIGAGAVVWSQF